MRFPAFFACAFPQGLLKRLVAELLGIRRESVGRFEVANAEMPPEVLGGKFCRLDIDMSVDGRLVNLEVQVRDEGDYPERANLRGASTKARYPKRGPRGVNPAWRD